MFETGLYCTVTYQNDQGDCFFFSYLLMKDGSNMGLVFHSGEEYRHEAVLIDGNPGELYDSFSSGEQSNLIWMDTTAGIAFNIGALMDSSTILHIAESVSLVNSTK